MTAARKRAAAVHLVIWLLDEMNEDSATKRRKRKRSTGESILRRHEREIYHLLVQELALEDQESYRNFFRLTKAQFCFVVDQLRPMLEPVPINIVRSKHIY